MICSALLCADVLPPCPRQEKISQLFGDCGLGFFGSTTQLKHFDSERGLFVLRAPRDSFSEVHFALTSICEVKKKPIVTRVLSVSSCNRTCREKLIQTYTTYVELDDSLLKAHKDQLWPNLLQRISTVDL
jgi:hypothetical protein